MISPYRALGVSEQASDAEIKQAYLQQVKEHPPERDPLRFRQIQQAYDVVKDQNSRLRYALFHLPELDFDALLALAFNHDGADRPMATDDFLKLLSTMSIEKTLAKYNKTPS
ncbi:MULTISPECIES: J domain-containing protein [Methylomonas]|uniref:J domain-containing protein n=1 Tax=Methylomonas TaxID=416 RepID=UPI00123256EE|nr:DnaJ domain-containing protein [Methylomonas rhizoryzae]